ncbi:hypothetical protein RSK20926_00775 [Roseobacter sp. SK209-2-6]|nr:hypothetical protein RSK20926_00775 [Roseobacter sp. SK209-2-6]
MARQAIVRRQRDHVQFQGKAALQMLWQQFSKSPMTEIAKPSTRQNPFYRLFPI